MWFMCQGRVLSQVPGPGMYEHNPKRVDGRPTWRRLPVKDGEMDWNI